MAHHRHGLTDNYFLSPIIKHTLVVLVGVKFDNLTCGTTMLSNLKHNSQIAQLCTSVTNGQSQCRLSQTCHAFLASFHILRRVGCELASNCVTFSLLAKKYGRAICLLRIFPYYLIYRVLRGLYVYCLSLSIVPDLTGIQSIILTPIFSLSSYLPFLSHYAIQVFGNSVFLKESINEKRPKHSA